MRLDKYLKVSRLIKRRTVANEACDAEIYWTATNTETTEETPSINLEVSSQTHEMNQS